MNAEKLGKIKCHALQPYDGEFQEQSVIVCDTETVKGKPYTIQFFDGKKAELFYVTADTILDCYCDYITSHYGKNLSVWFFYCPFDLPIIHYPYKELFTTDGHVLTWGDFEFNYVTGKTWFGNHKVRGHDFVERDAYQFVFRGLGKIAEDLKFTINKKPRPHYLGERKPDNEKEKKIFEEYALADVYVLWELVHWILNIHRTYNVGLAVSLADLSGKIFRKKFLHKPIIPTAAPITLASLYSYHGGKTELYEPAPRIIKNIYEYDIVSAYPYAMTQIGNFFDYEIEEWRHGEPIANDGLYNISGELICNYRPLYSHTFQRLKALKHTWVTGWELNSAKHCFLGKIHEGYTMISHYGKSENGLADYVWHFFAKKQQADKDKNLSERMVSKLNLNALYGKFISRIQMEDVGDEELWRGGVIFHPLIATLITGFVRAYVHQIEHACKSLHTSTDAFITEHPALDAQFPGFEGLGVLKKEYAGDALLIRPKVYVIFDSVRVNCQHKFDITEKDLVYCTYCEAKVLKSATHGFYGDVHMLLNMWKNNQVNYMVKRMMRLKEALKRRDPDVLPFVFGKQRRSLNVDWSQLTWRVGQWD